MGAAAEKELEEEAEGVLEVGGKEFERALDSEKELDLKEVGGVFEKSDLEGAKNPPAIKGSQIDVRELE